MEITLGEGANGADMVVMSKDEAVALVTAIVEALAKRGGSFGGGDQFRVLIKND